jgi:cytidylate kinase
MKRISNRERENERERWRTHREREREKERERYLLGDNVDHDESHLVLDGNRGIGKERSDHVDHILHLREKEKERER